MGNTHQVVHHVPLANDWIWENMADLNLALSNCQVQSYEAALKRLEEMTGLSEVDAIVKHFLDTDEANFELFNCVSRLNEDIESLRREVERLQDDEERLRFVFKNQILFSSAWAVVGHVL